MHAAKKTPKKRRSSGATHGRGKSPAATVLNRQRKLKAWRGKLRWDGDIELMRSD